MVAVQPVEERDGARRVRQVEDAVGEVQVAVNSVITVVERIEQNVLDRCAGGEPDRHALEIEGEAEAVELRLLAAASPGGKADEFFRRKDEGTVFDRHAGVILRLLLRVERRVLRGEGEAAEIEDHALVGLREVVVVALVVNEVAAQEDDRTGRLRAVQGARCPVFTEEVRRGDELPVAEDGEGIVFGRRVSAGDRAVRRFDIICQRIFGQIALGRNIAEGHLLARRVGKERGGISRGERLSERRIGAVASLPDRRAVFGAEQEHLVV